jgi:hypothetical protein
MAGTSPAMTPEREFRVENRQVIESLAAPRQEGFLLDLTSHLVMAGLVPAIYVPMRLK